MAIGTGAYNPNLPGMTAEKGKSMFGHMDMYAAQQAGEDPRKVLAFLNANLNTLGPNNAPGGGGVYDIVAQQASAIQAAETAAAQRAQEIKRLEEKRAQEIARQEQLQLEAEARQAERLRQMEIGARTQAANKARAGLQSSLQIKSQSKAPGTGGTQGFKRRKLQVNPTAYSAVAAGAPTTSTAPGVLNV
jgi:hypothetical protein